MRSCCNIIDRVDLAADYFQIVMCFASYYHYSQAKYLEVLLIQMVFDSNIWFCSISADPSYT